MRGLRLGFILVIACHFSTPRVAAQVPLMEREVGNWLLVEMFSEDLQANVWSATLEDEEGASLLTLRCAGYLSILVWPYGFVEPLPDVVSVRYRSGDRPPVETLWQAFRPQRTEMEALFASRAQREPIVKGFSHYGHLEVRMTHEDVTRTVTFRSDRVVEVLEAAPCAISS